METYPVVKAELEKDPRLTVDVLTDLKSLAAAPLADYDAVVLHFKNYDPEVPGRKGFDNLAGFVDEDHPGGPHAAAHRSTQRQVARPGHEQRPVRACRKGFGRDAGPDVDRDVAAPLVRPVMEPVAERGPANIVVVDVVSSAGGRGGPPRQQPHPRTDVDEQFGEVIGRRVARQPLGDARPVGFGQAEDGGQFPVEIDEQRWAR